MECAKTSDIWRFYGLMSKLLCAMKSIAIDCAKTGGQLGHTRVIPLWTTGDDSSLQTTPGE